MTEEKEHKGLPEPHRLGGLSDGTFSTSKSREKIFTDALRLELNRVDPQDKDKRKKINCLAEKLVECAIEDKRARRVGVVPVESDEDRPAGGALN